MKSNSTYERSRIRLNVALLAASQIFKTNSFKKAICGVAGARDFFDETALKLFQDIFEGRHIVTDDPVGHHRYLFVSAAQMGDWMLSCADHVGDQRAAAMMLCVRQIGLYLSGASGFPCKAC